MVQLNPRLYFGIIKSSVVRYIQIDLKYKFLLFSDVVWLVLDIVAFTFLGGMVDSAVEPNEYYHNFTVVEQGGFVVIEIYDSFANSYSGEKDIGSYIKEVGTLKVWEEWESGELSSFPSEKEVSIWIDDKPITYYLDLNNTEGVKPYQDGKFWLSKARLEDGIHFMEVRYKDVERTGVEEKKRELKTFSSSFFVGDNFSGETGSNQIYINIVDFSKEGNVWLQITNGSSYFNFSEGILEYSLDGKEDKVINFSTEDKYARLLPNNTIEIRNLKKADGSVDKGEHTITFKYTPPNTNTTYIGKKIFLVPTEEWQNNDLGIDYSLKKFFLIGVLFWAFFAKAYEDTVNTIPDEAARGTIGFLVTNHVNLSSLLLSRYVASSIKTFVITMIFVFPIIAWQDMVNFFVPGTYEDSVFKGFELKDIPTLFLIFLLMWLFMLVFAILISSLNIIFKRILPFAMMMVTGLKVLTGYYFPLEALETQLAALGGASYIIKKIPLVNGVYLIREIIVGKEVDVGTRMNEMFTGTIILAIVTMLIYKFLERKSRKWGTLEFY
ncbi:MAG TPA: hypothetical protein EYP29_00440 [Thermoplasmata archaeon]|nr:hypothetical protein [Thermoplasmata archaeon]